ncbi:hypothetical protein DKX38_001114 [Salix brachista]|uniref:Uncharacterized protein n=1 Tax=Salix brachista TaxID=2182728 RepID=A0A5N5P2A3_9ROSI|nr:hypothetical protein DKX38_001114 [Salix brachista]
MQFCCFELSPELPTNKTHEAIELFYRIPKFRCVPSVYSLNNLISVLCRNSKGLKLVPGILLKSQVMNIRVEESTFQVLITALCRRETYISPVKDEGNISLRRMVYEADRGKQKVCSAGPKKSSSVLLTIQSAHVKGGYV